MQANPPRRFLDNAHPPHIATLILLAGASALTMNIFLPSLPSMTIYFGTEYAVMQLSVAVYLGFSAFLQLFIGPISDKLGRRPVLLWGIALFCVATLGCLLTSNVYVFLVFRMAQAVIAVAMVLSRAVVRDMYPQDQAASMIGYVAMGMAVVPMIGPAIGGMLDQYIGWQANFWLLLVVGVALFWLVYRDLGETATSTDNTIAQQFREYPELLKSPRFWGYCLASAFGSGAFFAYLGGSPFVATSVFGLSPAKMGMFFAAPSLGYFVGNYLSGAHSARIGVNRMVLWGSLLIVLGEKGTIRKPRSWSF